MTIDVELVAHLEEAGYHPRTSKHSDFQSLLIVRDLVAQCPAIARKAASGEIVAKLRHHQQVGHADWVIDIAIGTTAGVAQPPAPSRGGDTAFPIRIAPPVIIQIAIELKSVWTEHGKARLNRLRDFNSFHGYAHQYSHTTVAAGFLIVNSAERFWSPLRPAGDITLHGAARKPARQLAKETVDRFRSIHLRDNAADASGMEAVGVVVIEHDNLLINPNRQQYADLHKPTRIAPVPPSPAVGDPLHYVTMIQRICNAYMQRFG
jgi:hypothetical protein